MKTPVPTEDQEQQTVVGWLNMKGLKFTAIPNSTYTTSWNQKRKNKLLGLNAGLPDLLVITPKGLVFIEMKRAKKSLSKITVEQALWIRALNECPGVEARICYGADDAIHFIEELL